jgi:Na+/proline symporter
VLIALFLFVALQLGVGFWAARSIRTEDDYLVAGRRLGPLLAAASIFATWFGAESCVGAAGTAYEAGIGPTSTEPFAYGLCLVLMGALFAARLWRLQITTLADFFARRFGASTERLAAVLLLPSSLLWAAAQIRAFGHVVAVNSGGAIGVDTAIAIAAGVAIVYTVAGGLLADVYTDLLQGILLLVGIGVLAVFVYGAWQQLPPPAAPTMPPPPPAPVGWWTVLESWAVPICGSIVAQEAISRSLAARSANVARAAAIGGGLLYLIAGTVPLLIGLVGPRLVLDLADPETILPHLSQQLLPGALNLLFAGALIAAILSTVDSCLLVVASIVARNLLPARSAKAEPRDQLRLARGATAAAGLIAYGFASSGWNVKELVEEASGFGSAGVFVLAVAGLYGRRGGALAANLTLSAGLVTWLLARFVAHDTIAHPYLLSLAAAGSAFAVGVLCERRLRVPRTAPPTQPAP